MLWMFGKATGFADSEFHQSPCEIQASRRAKRNVQRRSIRPWVGSSHPDMRGEHLWAEMVDYQTRQTGPGVEKSNERIIRDDSVAALDADETGAR
jgi:hypothetical protein